MSLPRLKKPKGKQETTDLVVSLILLVIVIAYYVFLIFGGHWFGATSDFYLALNLFSGVGNPNPWIRILSYALFLLSVSYIGRIVLLFIGSFLHRGRAIINLLASLVKYVAAIVFIFLVLQTFQVDTTAMLVSAGVVSLIIGLGCQSLISDVIAGLFIVFEGTFEIGDIVVVDDFRGTVREIGVRTTQIEDVGGNIKIINNSDLRTLINMTNKPSLAIVTCDVDYGESVERVEAVIKDNIERIRKAIPEILEGPNYLGVSELAASGVTLKFVAKCNEADRFAVERALLREIKIIFDENDVSIPFPQVTVNQPKQFKTASLEEKDSSKQFLEEQKMAAKDMPDIPNEEPK